MNCVFGYPRSGTNFLTLSYNNGSNGKVHNVHDLELFSGNSYGNVFSPIRNPLDSIVSFSIAYNYNENNKTIADFKDLLYPIEAYKNNYASILKNNNIIFKLEDFKNINKIVKFMCDKTGDHFYGSVNLEIVNHQLKVIETSMKKDYFRKSFVDNPLYDEVFKYYKDFDLTDCIELYKEAEALSVKI